MSGLILGTAGHIDHGKTSLVKALTGVDTDRLKEEKERGITIELGFAELALDDGLRFGVVDVPGHEAFVRAMVAGATGMDVVLLVVAADEGVMPQTREHVAIAELLGVAELVVAVTKCDTVDEDWLTLVDADIEALLRATPYHGARIIHTSARTGAGLEALRAAIGASGARVRRAGEDDLVRLPLDRVFTIQGTGTVGTGTLWSGSLRAGDRVRALPSGLEARVRGVQVHDREVDVATSGDRTAVALAGEGADRGALQRGATLVTAGSWRASHMLTARVRLLPDTEWTLAHNQRVHLHHGTTEVLARCALLEPGPLAAGETGWAQLRLEEPVAARARDRFVLRAYSPVTTIGGGQVAEPVPEKRTALDDGVRASLATLLDGSPADALLAHLELRGWEGSERDALPLALGATPTAADGALEAARRAGALVTPRMVFARAVRAEGEERVLAAVLAAHDADRLRPGVPLTTVRAALPRWAAPELADALVAALVDAGRIELRDGGAAVPGHRPSPSASQRAAVERLVAVLEEGGLSAPEVAELPGDLRSRSDLWSLLKHLEASGSIRLIADGLYLASGVLERATQQVEQVLGGRTDLGPADFKEVLPVTRKRLLPLLAYLDGQGTTVRKGEVRDVPEATKRRAEGT